MNPAARWPTKSANPCSRFIAKPRPPRASCMLNAELLTILRCPETHQSLTVAPPELVHDLNTKIASGALKNRNGQILREPIDGSLLREDQKFAYVIRKEIPVMLIDEAIPLI